MMAIITTRIQKDVFGQQVKPILWMSSLSRNRVCLYLQQIPSYSTNAASTFRIQGQTQFVERQDLNNSAICRSLYHCTPQCLFASSTTGIRTRRRRRGGGGSTVTDGNDSNDTDGEGGGGDIRPMVPPAIHKHEFRKHSIELLDRLEEALEPLTSLNDGMVLMRGHGDKKDKEQPMTIPARNMQPINFNIMEEVDGNKSDGKEKDNVEDQKDEEEEEHTTVVLSGDYLMIDLGPVNGQYTIEVDIDLRMIRFQSPLSGAIPYFFDNGKSEWRSIHDGHNFVGMLVRDLIRQIKGVPKL